MELLIFGADRPLEKKSTLNIPVKYLGSLKNAIELVTAYRASDVVVSPSIAENLSLVIMEGLSCGVPVVGFNIGGNCDMIDHLQNGYLALKDNLEDFASGIHWCIENNRDGNLSKAARRKVEEEFKPEIISDKYIRLYKNLL